MLTNPAPMRAITAIASSMNGNVSVRLVRKVRTRSVGATVEAHRRARPTRRARRSTSTASTPTASDTRAP